MLNFIGFELLLDSLEKSNNQKRKIAKSKTSTCWIPMFFQRLARLRIVTDLKIIHIVTGQRQVRFCSKNSFHRLKRIFSKLEISELLKIDLLN